jgi:hypothetical protein
MTGYIKVAENNCIKWLKQTNGTIMFVHPLIYESMMTITKYNHPMFFLCTRVAGNLEDLQVMLAATGLSYTVLLEL